MPYHLFVTKYNLRLLQQFVVVEGDNLLSMANMLFMAVGYHKLLYLRAIIILKPRDGLFWGVGGD